jgi:hypothetical protein
MSRLASTIPAATPKTRDFRTYADDSAMREASSMATDSGDSLEAALERFLEKGE